MNWIKNGKNYILSDVGFYISFLDYQTSTTLGINSWSNDKDQDETALCNRLNGEFYILNGDYRKEYEELFPKGYEACYDFFLANQDKKSSWSNWKFASISKPMDW